MDADKISENRQALDMLIEGFADAIKKTKDLEYCFKKLNTPLNDMTIAFDLGKEISKDFFKELFNSKKTSSEFEFSLEKVTASFNLLRNSSEKTTIQIGQADLGLAAFTQNSSKASGAIGGFFGILNGSNQSIIRAGGSMSDFSQTLNSTNEASLEIGKSVEKMSLKVTEASGKTSVMTNLLGGLKAGAIGAASAIVGMIVSEAIKYFTKLAEKKKDLKKASQDLGPVLENMGKRLTDSGNDAQGASKGLSEYRESVDDIIKSHGNFIEATKKKSYETEVDIALAEKYKETIHELSGKMRLNAEEQAMLHTAVAGLNDICGTNIQVIDAASGKLSESVAVIDQSTEAWKRNAIAQATQEVYLEYARDHVRATLSLEAAERKLQEVRESAVEGAETYKDAVDGKTKSIKDLEKEVEALRKEEARLEGQLISAGNAITANQEVTTSSMKGIEKYIDQSSAWSAALDGSTRSAMQLSAVFNYLGITTAELEKAGADNFASLVSSYDESIDSLMAKCVELGIYMPGKFKEIARELGPEVALGYLDGLDPYCAEEIMKEMGVKSIDALKEELEISSPSAVAARLGMYLAEGFSQGIEDDESADLAAKRIAHLTLQTMQLEAAAKKASVIGEDFSAGFADGMKSLQHAVEASGIAASRAARAGMESESTNASVWGGHMVGGLAEGIRGAVGLVQNAASFIAGNIRSFLHFTRPDQGPLRDYETWMPDMVEGLAFTLRKAAPVIYAEARAVAQGISENINDWEISTSNMRKSTMHALATRGSMNASLHGVGTTNNYYTIDGVNYVPDSRMAELMAEVMSILVRENNMRRVNYA